MPSSGQERPRGAGPASVAKASQVHTACQPQPGAAPTAPTRCHAASRCRCFPTGWSQEPRAGPWRRSAFRAERVHRSTRASADPPHPRDHPFAHMATIAMTRTGLRERLWAKKRGLCWGETRGPDGAAQSHELPFQSLFTCCGQRPGTGSILVKSRARKFNRGSTLALKINKRLKPRFVGASHRE